MSRSKKRIGKKRFKKGFLISIMIIAVIAVTATWLYYNYYTINPTSEQALRNQFGDDFFDDFNDLPEEETEAEKLEDIIERYEPLFDNLHDTATERLENLFQAALTEYNERKKAGTYDRFQLTNKYIQAGKLLEKRVDESFYLMLNQMESELKRKELPTEVITEIETAYEETKSEKMQELFGRLREKLDNKN